VTKQPMALEVIVRGVWEVQGRILLCRNRGATYAYLPGGHIEPGEGAEAALRREMREETGGRFTVGRFLGADEEVFRQRGQLHAELNLVFAMEGPARWVFPRLPSARESHLEFFWARRTDLELAGFLPRKLARRLLEWTRHGPGWSGLADRTGKSAGKRIA